MDFFALISVSEDHKVTNPDSANFLLEKRAGTLNFVSAFRLEKLAITVKILVIRN